MGRGAIIVNSIQQFFIPEFVITSVLPYYTIVTGTVHNFMTAVDIYIQVKTTVFFLIEYGKYPKWRPNNYTISSGCCLACPEI